MLQHLLLLNFIYTEYYINAAGNVNVLRVDAVFDLCQLVDGHGHRTKSMQHKVADVKHLPSRQCNVL